MNKHTHPGKFFAFEGIDGCGGETQTNKLVAHLKERSLPVEKLSYPDYAGPIGKLIHEYLHAKYDFSKDVQLLLYFADFLKDKQKIEQWLNEGKMLVADRYVPSTLAYQCGNDVPLQTGLEMTRLFKLPVPDKIIYLDITPETSILRKTKEKQGNLDRHESDRQFLSDLVHSYKRLRKENIFAPWEVVEGEQSIEEVASDIWQIISPP